MNANSRFNWPIIGHEKIKRFLEKCVANSSFAHAYLFHGPEMSGKMALAKAFSASLLCENFRLLSEKKENLTLPCGVCSPCRQFQKKIHPDFYIVEKEVNEKTGQKKNAISVSQIRALLEKISKRSFSNSFKIIIFPEADALNEEASNCLLKSLEEPPARTIYILIALQKDALLPTILSRMQTFKFLPVPKETIYQYLMVNGANRDAANSISRIAVGRPTAAVDLFANAEKFRRAREEKRELLKFFTGGIVERFQLVESFINENHEQDAMLSKLDQLEIIARDILLFSFQAKDLAVCEFLGDELTRLAAGNSAADLTNFIFQIAATKRYLRANVNARLALENLVI
ncbi:AAA family ATPase [Candidatus Falkowbacteria bacterium]|nr:AAA family ATPase [Candidatus Falkowbacteria bacterium]